MNLLHLERLGIANNFLENASLFKLPLKRILFFNAIELCQNGSRSNRHHIKFSFSLVLFIRPNT